MARANIRMTPEEVAAFLETRELATIVAGAEGEAPHAALGGFHHRNGATTFTVDARARIVEALVRNERACCIVDRRAFETETNSYYDTKAAMLHGRARRIGDAAPGKARFEFVIEKVVSFDFDRLRPERKAAASA